MLSQCPVPSITKNIFSYLMALGQQPLIALQIQIFHYILKYILKSTETFFISKLLILMPKNTNKTKQTEKKINRTTDSLIEKY